MKPDEKYNQIISKIEKHVAQKPYKKKKEILDILMAESGYYSRQNDFNAIFRFINGQRPLDYINSRKLMYAYKYMMSCKQYSDVDMNHVLEITGQNDQPAFINTFKDKFGKTPKKFLDFYKDENERKNFYEEPEYWGTFDDRFIDEVQMMETDVNGTQQETYFGISKEIYDRFITMQNLAAVYGCSNEAAEAAYRFSEETGLDLEKSFELTSQFQLEKEQIQEEFEEKLKEGKLSQNTDTVEKYYINDLLRSMKDKTVIHCCFDLGLSVKEAQAISDRELFTDVDLSKVDKIHAYALLTLPNCFTHEVMTVTDYFLKQNGDKEVDYSQFYDYLEQVWEHGNYEAAYDHSLPISESIIEEIENRDPYVDFMQKQKAELDESLNGDDEIREDWMYYRNPHIYPDDDNDDTDSGDTVDSDLWEEFIDPVYYSDDDD